METQQKKREYEPPRVENQVAVEASIGEVFHLQGKKLKVAACWEMENGNHAIIAEPV